MAKRATIYLSSDTLAHLGECDNLSRRIAEMARICAHFDDPEYVETCVSRYHEIIDAIPLDFTEDEWRVLGEALGRHSAVLTARQARAIVADADPHLGEKLGNLSLAAQYAVLDRVGRGT